MYKKEYTEQAYPNALADGNTSAWQDGMTLLDYFAAKAMQGYCSRNGMNPTWDDRAKWAYQQAAAMMEERKKYLQDA